MNATPLSAHDPAAELLGAYALDALEPAETARVEAHLRICGRCRGEVAANREVAGLLAQGGTAPSVVWDRIMADIDGPPPPRVVLDLRARPAASWSPPGGPPAPDGGRRPRRSSGGGRRGGGDGRARELRRPGRAVRIVVAVAAALGALAFVGVRLVGSGAPAGAPSARGVAVGPTMADVRAALGQPGARTVRLSGGAVPELSAVILPDGHGWVYASRLTGLPSSQTYQLWGITGSRAVSYGLLGPQPAVVAFRAASGVRALAVTVEAAGGADAPTTVPVASGPVT